MPTIVLEPADGTGGRQDRAARQSTVSVVAIEAHRSGKGKTVRAGMLAAAKRRHAYLARRAEGWTYEEIAEEMEVAPSTVRRVINNYLDRLAAEDRENAPRAIHLELTRLDQLERGLWPRARAGQLSA